MSASAECQGTTRASLQRHGMCRKGTTEMIDCELFEDEIALLEAHYGDVEADPEYPFVVVILDFPLPGSFDQEYSELLIDLGRSYPDFPPQDFYLEKGLTRDGGRPSSHYFENMSDKFYCEEGWAWYSFHIDEWRYNPHGIAQGHCLLTATDALYRALEGD